MISFKPIFKENADEVLNALCVDLDDDEADMLATVIEGILAEDDEDVEYAITVACGCALVRIFDTGRYFFLYPCDLSEKFNFLGAINAISEYAMREEIPLAFCGVPAEALSMFSGFRHINIDAEDPACDYYRLRVETECMLLDEIPTSLSGRVELNALSNNDEKLYAELCKDKNVNKYWGYDYSEDVKLPSDEYFLSEANREFMSGVALPLAVRVSGELVGDAVIYAFDGKGGAEFAIRLFENRQGQGIASDAFGAIADIAIRIGLVRLRASVMSENNASLAFADKFMERISEKDGRVNFLRELY